MRSHAGSLRVAPRATKNRIRNATAQTLDHTSERVAMATAKNSAAVISSVGSSNANSPAR